MFFLSFSSRTEAPGKPVNIHCDTLEEAQLQINTYLSLICLFVCSAAACQHLEGFQMCHLKPSRLIAYKEQRHVLSFCFSSFVKRKH